jgi:hypothetical protein
MEPPDDSRAPSAPPSAPPEPGERGRVLDRPPSDRYKEAAPAPSTDTPVSGRAPQAVLAALVGAAVITILGGPLSVTVGLVGVAAVIGWAIGSIVRPSLGLAVGLAIASIALGLIGVWLVSRFEGGVLSLPDYLGQVQGPLVAIEIAVAAIVAAATVR